MKDINNSQVSQSSDLTLKREVSLGNKKEISKARSKTNLRNNSVRIFDKQSPHNPYSNNTRNESNLTNQVGVQKLNNSFNPDNKYSGRASKNLVKTTSKGSAQSHNHSM